MEPIRKIVIQLFLIGMICVSPLSGQDGGKLSLLVTPGINLPVGTPTEMFTLGGGAELSGIFSMPFAPWLGTKGSLDYSFVPTASQEATNNLSLLTFSAGAGPVIEAAPWLSFYAFGSGGYGLGIYKGETGGSAYIGAEAGVSFILSPSFGIGAGGGYRHYFSKPTPFYQGINVHLGSFIRFGQGGKKPNIEMIDIRFDPVFPVFYKHYDNHTLGSITLQNSESGPIEDVKVSLYIQQYMDGPKQCALFETMGKNETREVPLYALFADNVLSITEGTKVAAEVISEYTFRGKELTKKETQTVRLYDRNAMTWDDDRKAAAFCTAKDPEILRFSKNVAGLVRDHQSKAVNLNFRIAMGLFEGLKLHGVNYVIDPQTPYSDFSADAAVVDYLQFPVQTLEYKAGDCDDLSILYTALLESTGIETAFITVPGHIFAAFSLGIPPAEAKKLFKNPGDLIYRDDTVWLPVEITLMQQGFLKAWETGAREWREHDPEGKAALFPVHEAWTEYEPVGLTGAGSGIAFPDQEIVMAEYTRAVNRFVEREIAGEVEALESKIAESREPARLQNKLGVLYARYGLLDKAEGLFEAAAKNQHVPAMINIGNLLYLKEDYTSALKYYEQADDLRPGRPAALIGLAKVNYELENFGTVKRIYEEIQRKDPDAAVRFSYLTAGADDTARASAVMDRETVRWAEEE